MSDPRDAEFHDEDLSALYRVTRDPEPPAWLDQRILTAANAAPQPVQMLTPSPSRRRRTRLWAVPAALAKRIAVASPSPAEAGVKTKPGGAKEKGGAKARPSASTAGAAVPSMPSLEPPPRVEVS